MFTKRYWAIGVSPSINDIEFSHIASKVLTTNGFKSNYTEPKDYNYWRVYGTEISS